MIIGYIHVCQKGEWRRSFQMLMKSIEESGLYDHATVIRICVVNDFGKVVEDPLFEKDKFEIHFVGESKEYERPTLLHMRKQAENAKYFYVHTKGLRHFGLGNEQCVVDWINLLLYWNIEKWRDAVDKLDVYDTYGCNDTGFHYSGNFWWATSAHIRTLPDKIGDYYTAAEDWVQINRDNKYCVYKSGLQGFGHYNTPFPREKYHVS
jgi:hypothetical protein